MTLTDPHETRSPIVLACNVLTRNNVLFLPYPPSLNNLYATVRGKRVLTAKGRAYKQLAAALAVRSGIKPILGSSVAVTMRLYRPRKAGDLANYEKVAFDAMKGIAWRDDSQITEIHMYRFDDPAKPRLELEISAV